MEQQINSVASGNSDSEEMILRHLMKYLSSWLDLIPGDLTDDMSTLNQVMIGTIRHDTIIRFRFWRILYGVVRPQGVKNELQFYVLIVTQ